MAAVETLRRGYGHFIITGAQSENNVRVIQTAPTGAYTSGTFNTYGNTTYGNAQTTFTGGGPIIMGSRDANLMVLMLRAGDAGYENSLDAKIVLGTDWEKIAQKGINTCSDN